MNYTDFEKTAHEVWDAIPQAYKEGVDGLIIERDARTHPEHDDFFTLGECVTEAYPSEYGGPDTIRSAVVLYYGSFRAIALDNHDFDWGHEVHETILHELQHHLEHLAEEDALEDFDYAVEHNFRRVEGQPFDPLFYRAGEPIGENSYRVDADVFVEVHTRTSEAIDYALEWEGATYQLPIPRSDADVLYVILDQDMTDVSGDFCVVRLRRRGALRTLRAAFSGQTVEEVLVAVQAH